MDGEAPSLRRLMLQSAPSSAGRTTVDYSVRAPLSCPPRTLNSILILNSSMLAFFFFLEIPKIQYRRCSLIGMGGVLSSTSSLYSLPQGTSKSQDSQVSQALGSRLVESWTLGTSAAYLSLIRPRPAQGQDCINHPRGQVLALHLARGNRFGFRTSASLHFPSSTILSEGSCSVVCFCLAHRASHTWQSPDKQQLANAAL